MKTHPPLLLFGLPHRSCVPYRGVAALELAIVLPILLTFLLGVLEVGRMLDVQVMLETAVGVGGRQASTGLSTNAQVQQDVINNLTFAGLPTQDVTVTVEDLTTPGTDATQAAELDTLQVTVTIPFSDVRWAATALVTDNNTMLSATSTFRSARVNPYPTNIEPPVGN
ncbi:MAG: TadE/TadG family type IV pilus assembly protein [Thermoguttaceae bacterium]|jgi:Flp pilus assembly protein TadG